MHANSRDGGCGEGTAGEGRRGRKAEGSLTLAEGRGGEGGRGQRRVEDLSTARSDRGSREGAKNLSTSNIHKPLCSPCSAADCRCMHMIAETVVRLEI